MMFQCDTEGMESFGLSIGAPVSHLKYYHKYVTMSLFGVVHFGNSV